MKNQRGFTLIELLILIMIFGAIFMAITIGIGFVISSDKTVPCQQINQPEEVDTGFRSAQEKEWNDKW